MTETVPSGQSPQSATLDCPKCQSTITYYDVTGSSYYGCSSCCTFFQYENEGPPKILASFPHATVNIALPIGTEGYLNNQFLRVVEVMHKKEANASHNWSNYVLLRNLLVVGTAVSWYFGIIQFNGDLAFTMLNVVSHGIPYMALIWVSDRPKVATESRAFSSSLTLTARHSWVIFVGILVILAYLEEGLWDGLVWREHATVFGWFQSLPTVTDHQALALLVPLLALPQMTHYVLDGFIWRRNHST